MPCPSANGFLTGPGFAVEISVALTSLGVIDGWSESSSATMPDVIAAENDEPDPTKFTLPMWADVFCS